MTPEQEATFYKELKGSVVSTKTEADDHLPYDSQKLAEQLLKFHAAINSSKQNETYMKCLMGRNLLKIQTKSDMKGTAFITFVKMHLTEYGQSEIYFMMKL